MRSVHKDFDHPPAALQLQAVKDAIAALLATDDRSVIQSDLYRGRMELPDGSVKFEVVEALMGLYNDKCAYCETKEFDPQIEHYRPKNKVTGARKHPGYFWLAFEWSNLVSTCFDCNKIGKGKGNRFPLLGGEANRLSTPPLSQNGSGLDVNELRPDHPQLSKERPYLLHPEFDIPEICFAFDNEGLMSGIDAEGRGKETIKICNLNRKNLRYRRQKALEFFVIPIRNAMQAFDAGGFDNNQLLLFLKFTFQRFEDWGQPKEEYSLFGKFAFENFSSLVLTLLPKGYRAVIEEAFRRFQLGQL